MLSSVIQLLSSLSCGREQRIEVMTVNMMKMMIIIVAALPFLGRSVNRDVVEGKADDQPPQNPEPPHHNSTSALHVTYARLNLVTSQVVPPSTPPYGWTTNPFITSGTTNAEIPSPFTGATVTAAPPTTDPTHMNDDAGSTETNPTSTAGPLTEATGSTGLLPAGFPTGGLTSLWGHHISENHASWIWGLRFQGWTASQWVRWLG